MMKLDNSVPRIGPSQSGIFSGDMARVSSTTVGYSPIHTAMDVLVADGGGASLPLSSNANQLPNEWSTVRSLKSANFLPSSSKRLRSPEDSQASRSCALS